MHEISRLGHVPWAEVAVASCFLLFYFSSSRMNFLYLIPAANISTEPQNIWQIVNSQLYLKLQYNYVNFSNVRIKQLQLQD